VPETVFGSSELEYPEIKKDVGGDFEMEGSI
jgi:hypothetical protein